MGAVVDAVRRDLAALELRAPGVEASTEAVLAVELARRVDAAEKFDTATSLATGKLLEVMAALRASAPATSRGPLDEIRERRDKRLARGAEAKDQSGSGGRGSS